MGKILKLHTDANEASVVMVALDKIRPNRYRRGEISEEKVEALVRSYETSGFWDGSIQGRPHPDERGCVEIAFGHHRVAAAKRMGYPTIGIVVSERSNDDMMKMMANENSTEFGGNTVITKETIASVIDAWGRDEITLEGVDPKTNKAHIQHALPAGKAYTLSTVARYLGWIKKSDGNATLACRTAFDAYHRETVSKVLDTLPAKHQNDTAARLLNQAATVARVTAEKANLKPHQVRRAEKLAVENQAKMIVDRDSAVGVRGLAESIGKAAANSVKEKKVKSPPPVEIYIQKLIDRCVRANPIDDIRTEALRLMPAIDYVPKDAAEKLANELEKLGARVQEGAARVAKALRSGKQSAIKQALQLTDGGND